MWETIVNIVLAVLSVAFAFLSYYFEIKNKLIESVNGEISNAEDTDKKNKEKMAFVVEKLKAIVPKPMRFLFTDKALEKIAQTAFDKIEEYAKKQKKK
ncbi:MAG: hypothetical protein IIX02_06270 [Clostridia bacterium]|nr:hypothetical protein [Clostridia bacterium]